MILEDDLPPAIIPIIYELDRADFRLRLQHGETEFYFDFLSAQMPSDRPPSPQARASELFKRKTQDLIHKFIDNSLLLFQIDLDDRVQELYFTGEHGMSRANLPPGIPGHRKSGSPHQVALYTFAEFEKKDPPKKDIPGELYAFFGQEGIEKSLHLRRKKVFTPSEMIQEVIIAYGTELRTATLPFDDKYSKPYRQAIRIPIPLGNEDFPEL